jgi:hypothetical protein
MKMAMKIFFHDWYAAGKNSIFPATGQQLLLLGNLKILG